MRLLLTWSPIPRTLAPRWMGLCWMLDHNCVREVQRGDEINSSPFSFNSHTLGYDWPDELRGLSVLWIHTFWAMKKDLEQDLQWSTSAWSGKQEVFLFSECPCQVVHKFWQGFIERSDVGIMALMGDDSDYTNMSWCDTSHQIHKCQCYIRWCTTAATLYQQHVQLEPQTQTQMPTTLSWTHHNNLMTTFSLQLLVCEQHWTLCLALLGQRNNGVYGCMTSFNLNW